MNPWLVRHVTFPLFQRWIGENVEECLQELERTQWYSAAQLEELQWQRLKSLVAHCYAHVPYYRAMFDALGAAPDDIKDMDDFRRLPLLTKQDLHGKRRELEAHDEPRRCVEVRSSGSTGIPTRLNISRAANSYRWAAKARARRWWGWQIYDHTVMLMRVPTPRNLFDSQAMGKLLKRKFVDNVMLLNVFDLSRTRIREYYRRMQQARPKYMYALTSGAYTLARFMQEEGLDGAALGLRGICVTSEVLYPHQRETIGGAFGCPVIDEYGSTEVGDIACECPEGNMHLNADLLFVEFIKDGCPAAPGELATVVVTPLMDRCTPLLRYCLGDIAVHKAQQCTCGRGLPAIEISVGRESDVIYLQDGRVLHDLVITGHHERAIYESVQQYRVYQKSLSHFHVLVAAKPGTEQVARVHFEELLHRNIGPDVTISFEFVDEVPREASGKMRYFVSELDKTALSPQAAPAEAVGG